MISWLWAIFTVMAALAAAGVAIPLVRRYDAAAHDGEQVTGLIRSNLADVDDQLASGAIDAATAAALKTELKRRMVVEARARPLPVRLLGDRRAARLALGLAAVVAVGATALYAVQGRPDLAAGQVAQEIAAANPQAQGADPGGDVTAALEARLQAHPQDAEGWRLLGTTYFQQQRFGDAVTAYARAVALKPGDAELHSAQGEAMTQAAGGMVTPPAAAAFQTAHRLDPADPRARYFLALARDQAGDHAGAIADWVALLNSAPPDAPWAGQLRGFVEQAARAAKIDLAGRLKSAPPVLAGAANARGPDAAQVAAAGGMSEAGRAAFIRGMVDNLAAKLAANPRDADGWIRLIRARKVLGDDGAARAALASGRKAFADDPATAKSIADAAAALGVG